MPLFSDVPECAPDWRGRSRVGHTHSSWRFFFSGSLQTGDFVGALVRRVKGSWNNLRRSLASYSVHIATPPLCGPPTSWLCICKGETSSRNVLVWTRAMSSDSSESHFCNRAQPSAALLLQLSLFLRHSSEAISLTRPAHFFFPLLPSPTPLLFFTITLHYTITFFFFAALFRFCRTVLQSTGSFLRCTLFLLFPGSFSLALSLNQLS